MTAGILNVGLALDKPRLYRTVAFISLAAVVASAGVITYYNRSIAGLGSAETGNSLYLAAVTLVPYLISAVIIAASAIGVVTILPTTRLVDPAARLLRGLKEVRSGDLTTRVRLSSEDPLKEVAGEFNAALGGLGNQISEWKYLNRQQWGVLCRIRHAVEHGDCERTLRYVAEMEVNWDRIAEIERQLIA
jgi:methyl-accepting chemotaxis protein